jgi:hypothetical protein
MFGVAVILPDRGFTELPTELGWTYLVYSGRQIKRDTGRCIEQIRRTLDALSRRFTSQLRESREMTLSEWKQTVAILMAFDDGNGLEKLGRHGTE